VLSPGNNRRDNVTGGSFLWLSLIKPIAARAGIRGEFLTQAQKVVVVLDLLPVGLACSLAISMGPATLFSPPARRENLQPQAFPDFF
jgi:hypothetical protein